MYGTRNTSTTGAKPSFIERHAPDRARAIRFLATRTAAFSGAYSISVSSSGDITLQGEAGALQDLVVMWNAEIVQARDRAVPTEYTEWLVRHDNGLTIRLVEEPRPLEPVVVWCDVCDRVATPRHPVSEHNSQPVSA